MACIQLICGKICSGKSYYARMLQARHPAVILSTDEATYDLIRNEQGEFYNIFAARTNLYLRKKAVEIVRAGADVILDWGFWTRKDRQEIVSFLQENDVSYVWHYMDIGDELWQQHIAERNGRIEAGMGGQDFYVDDGLMHKLLSLFETPEKEEMDVWYNPEQEMD